MYFYWTDKFVSQDTFDISLSRDMVLEILHLDSSLFLYGQGNSIEPVGTADIVREKDRRVRQAIIELCQEIFGVSFNLLKGASQSAFDLVRFLKSSFYYY